MKLLPILMLFVSCGTSQKEVAKDDTIKVKLNDTFEIKLGVSLGTGYSWSPVDSNWKNYLVLDSSYTVANPSGKEDGPETQVFRFKAIAKGETVVEFNHGRPWKKEEKPDRQKSFTVTIM